MKFDDFGEIEDIIDQEELNHLEIDMHHLDMDNDHYDSKKPLVGKSPKSSKIQAEGGSIQKSHKKKFKNDEFQIDSSAKKDSGYPLNGLELHKIDSE